MDNKNKNNEISQFEHVKGHFNVVTGSRKGMFPKMDETLFHASFIEAFLEVEQTRSVSVTMPGNRFLFYDYVTRSAEGYHQRTDDLCGRLFKAIMLCCKQGFAESPQEKLPEKEHR